MTKITAASLASLVGLVYCLAAAAFAADNSYYYGGVALGQSSTRIDSDRITADLLAGGLTTTTMTRDQKAFGYKVFGGYQFNRYIALEAGYFNLGDFGFKSTTSPAGTLNGDMKLQGLNFDLVGTLSLSERFSVIGRAGGQYAWTRDRFSGTGAVVVADLNPSVHRAGFKFGGGLQYEFTPAFLIRGEAERYRINDAVGNHGDVDLFSVSLVFPFGRTHAVPAHVADTPAYVAPAPVPEVVAPPRPVVQPERRRRSFSADSLFAFDKADVSLSGRQALDVFVKDLSGSTYDVITVEGFTDRLGSPAYNQKLSLRRAEAVQDYLVSSSGIPAGKVSAVGKGSSSPLTKPDECTGSKRTAKLISCLQPDRRVEVEVVGTR